MNAQQTLKPPSFASDPEAALEFYREYGYHIEENVWTSTQCQEIIQAAENLPTFKDGTFAPAMQPHRDEPFFLTAMQNPVIVAIMERLISGKVSGLQAQFFHGRPGTPGFTMHQDNSFVESKPDAFASAWSAMQDVTVQMGALVGYPGSQQEPILPRVEVHRFDQASQDVNANSEEVVLPDIYHPVDLPVPKGAALFMHSHFVHSSHDNNSNEFRRALLYTYIRSGEHFRPGNSAKRAEINVY